MARVNYAMSHHNDDIYCVGDVTQFVAKPSRYVIDPGISGIVLCVTVKFNICKYYTQCRVVLSLIHSGHRTLECVQIN